MLVRLFKAIALLTLAAFITTATAWGQEAQKSGKNWKDRGEYDLYAAITKETSPQKKLELLNTWKEKYPETDFKVERLQLYLNTYKELSQPNKMIETAKEMLAINPKELTALYWICTLSPRIPKPNEQDFDTAEKAAQTLVASLDDTFAMDKKPATTSEAEWKKGKNDMAALGHKTVGWVEMQRKNWEAAEEQFRKSLEADPSAGEVAYWLGTVMIAEKKPEKSSAAIYEIARAASYDGAGALNPQGRQEVEKYLEKLYTQYHGSAEGLAELKAQAKTHAVPPPDFKVKTAAEVAFEKEEAFKKANPALALWQSTKKALEGENGQQFWEERVKTALLPGGAGGVEKFTGRLVSQKPARNPKELVLGIDNATTPEVTLKLDQPVRGSAPEGTEISFSGVATDFTKEPFMLTFEVETKNLDGWPEAAPAKKRSR